MDPVLEEILRVKEPADIQFHSLRRWQGYIRDVLGPNLDHYDHLVRPRPDAPLVERLDASGELINDKPAAAERRRR